MSRAPMRVAPAGAPMPRRDNASGERPRVAGIIAAGHGERLRAVSGGAPKPMVAVRGKPLVHWVVSALAAAGVRRVVLLRNSSGDPIRDYLRTAFPGLEWTFLKRDTASSWESFRLVARTAAESAPEFLMSTTDALAPPAELARFSDAALAPFADGAVPAAALALTSFVEDEKPLRARLAPDGRVSALGPKAEGSGLVTGGVYALTRAVADRLGPADAYARLRDFWIDLVDSGQAVRGVSLADTVDVDRPEDLPAAEKVTACFEP